MIKDFQLQTINDIPVEITPIPGINSLQLNYEASIGGANAPEPGADKTSENVSAGIASQGALATLNSVGTDQILDEAITSLKIAAGAVSAAKTSIAAINPSTGEINANKVGTTQIDTNAVTEAKILASAITENKIAVNAVTESKILASAITEAKIAVNAVTEGKIASNAVSTSKLALAAVTADIIAASAITENKIYTGAVTADKIAANAITSAKIDANAIIAGKIAAGVITATEISAGAITTEKLYALSVTSDKVDALAITAGKIAAGAVTTEKLYALAVTTDKIDALAITAAKIAAGAITAEKISAGAVTASKITSYNFIMSAGSFSNNSPSAGRISWSSVKVVYNGTEYTISNSSCSATEKHIYWQLSNPTVFSSSVSLPALGNDDFLVAFNNSGAAIMVWNSTVINGNRITAGSISATQIAANSITANEIAATTITANEIAASTITAAKMNVSQLSAITANLGSITSGTVTGALLQTSSSDNTGVKMSSAIGGINVYGEALNILDTAGTLYGYVGGYNGYMALRAVSGRNMLIGADNATVFFGNNVGTAVPAGGLLGSSSAPWNTIYGGNLVSNNLYATNSASYLRWFSSAWNFQHKVVAPEVSTPYLTGINTIRLDSTASPLTDNGSIYFNGTHLYVRIGGAWKQLDN